MSRGVLPAPLFILPAVRLSLPVMRFTTAILFFLFLPGLATAQRTFKAGVLAGINGSQIHGDDAWGYDKGGFVGGIFVSTDPEKRVYGEMEMQYTMKGSRKLAAPDKGDFFAFEYRLNYVEVPVLLRINYKKLFFEIGPGFGVLVNDRQFDNLGYEIHRFDFRRTELSYIGGVGYAINEHWLVNFRSTNSLLPVYKTTAIYYPNWWGQLFNRGMYNNVIGLTAQYRFQKAKPKE
ncbi:MAG: hypothetical protein FD123_1180 [Bacteroidetes bacterium]|nr:MAG: hypothetical protein FD123_1180 [Bacteroidota bacterium]